jgi:hypothetical protein
MAVEAESGVIVPVPAAEAVVAEWRERFDISAAQGVPAHITALYPFLPADRLTAGVVSELRELCAAMPVLDVWFRRTARFPGMLYLDPEPANALRAFTTSIAERWPETPPYGGAFDDVIPHLTVAYDVAEPVLDDVESRLLPRLPVSARLSEARLYVFNGERWRLRAELPFQGSASSSPS